MRLIYLDNLRYIAIPGSPHWCLHPLDIRVGDATLSREEFEVLTLACGQKLKPKVLHLGSEVFKSLI